MRLRRTSREFCAQVRSRLANEADLEELLLPLTQNVYTAMVEETVPGVPTQEGIAGAERALRVLDERVRSTSNGPPSTAYQDARRALEEALLSIH